MACLPRYTKWTASPAFDCVTYANKIWCTVFQNHMHGFCSRLVKQLSLCPWGQQEPTDNQIIQLMPCSHCSAKLHLLDKLMHCITAGTAFAYLLSSPLCLAPHQCIHTACTTSKPCVTACKANADPAGGPCTWDIGEGVPSFIHRQGRLLWIHCE